MTIAADGWVDDVRRIVSPNFAPRPPDTTIVLAVVHGISLPPGVFSGDAVERLFTNRLDAGADPSFRNLCDLRVSAHFFIRRGGTLIQFVSCRDAAWHAGDSYWRQRRNCNDFSIGIELEGDDTTPYTEQQYDRLTALLAALAGCYPGIVVAGHADIAPQRKTDPGDAFDWTRLFAALGDKYDGRQST